METLAEKIERAKADFDAVYELGYDAGSAASAGGDDATDVIEGTVTRFINDKAKKIAKYLCYENTKLVEVNLPNVETVAQSAFKGCSSLADVNLPKCTHIDIYAFESCDYLTNINLDEVVTIRNYAFRYAFRYSKGSPSIVLPKVEKINPYAFNYCSTIVSVDLYVCTQIGTSAFAYCSNLTKVIIRTPSVCTIDASSFGSNAKFYVPDNLVEDYKAATNWSNIASRIKPLSELPSGAT